MQVLASQEEHSERLGKMMWIPYRSRRLCGARRLKISDNISDGASDGHFRLPPPSRLATSTSSNERRFLTTLLQTSGMRVLRLLYASIFLSCRMFRLV